MSGQGSRNASPSISEGQIPAGELGQGDWTLDPREDPAPTPPIPARTVTTDIGPDWAGTEQRGSSNSSPSPPGTASVMGSWQHIPESFGGYLHSTNSTSPDDRTFPGLGSFGHPDKEKTESKIDGNHIVEEAGQFVPSDDACLSFSERNMKPSSKEQPVIQSN